MALLSQALKDKEVDIRMIQRGLNKGFVSLDEVEKMTKRLQDETESAEFTNLETFMEGLGGKSGLRD